MICAIVPAAGLSNRMGTQKLLLPFGGKTVITHIVEQILASSVDRVFVVVGHQKELVSRKLSSLPVRIVHNPDYKTGMLSSIRCGLSALPEQCQSILVALGDQPSITTTLINQMIRFFAETKKSILVPLYNNKRGHPILFSISYRQEILSSFDNIGLRGLLQVHDGDVFEMPVEDPSVLSDMDYPEDFRRELEKFDKTNDKA
jgi:molybdenum cofactor cytidylyltransferase